MKKLFAVLLAVAMLLSLGVTAFADDQGKIVILDPPENSTYTAYKIFTAEVVGSDVTYYASADWDETLFTIADDGSNKATTVDDPALYGLKFVYVDSGNYEGMYKVEKSTGYDAAKFAQYVSDHMPDFITGETIEKDDDSGEYSAMLVPGYYLVKCTNPESLALTTVLPGATVKVQNKKDMPLEKTVDTPEATGEDNNNTGVSVGDVLKYKIESKVPTISADAETYTFVISDTMSEGLTFGNKLKITIGDEVHELTYDPETGTFTDSPSGTTSITPGTDGADPATVATQIAALNAAIAKLDGEANVEGSIAEAQAAVTNYKYNMGTVDDATDDKTVSELQTANTNAQNALSAAQTKLTALQAAVITAPTVYPATVDGVDYQSYDEIVTAYNNQPAAVAAAQTAANAAAANLSAAQTELAGLQAEVTARTDDKTAKQNEIAALQASLNGTDPVPTAAVETFELVDNATDLLNGDQVRFGWNGKTFELSIDMKSRKAMAGQDVTIEYEATVNEDAVAEILQNTAVLAFGEDNDIDYRDAETDNYTSQLIIDKFETGNRSQKLAGAEFKLMAKDGENVGKYYKLTGKRVVLDGDSPDGLDHKVGDGEETNVNSPLVYEDTSEDIDPIYFQADKDGKLQVAMLDKTTPTDENGNPVFANADNGGAFYGDIKVEWVDSADDASVVKTDAEGRGVFGYLPDGTFDLIETKAPINYIQLTAPIEIVIDGHRAVDKTLSMNERINALTKAANVENTPGQSLPSTGGTGATLLTIGGVVLMLAAGAFLVLRRRKEQE